MSGHALDVLEFERVLERIARRASCALGRARILALRPSHDREDIVRELARVDAAMRFVAERPDWGLGTIPDVVGALDQLGTRGTDPGARVSSRDRGPARHVPPSAGRAAGAGGALRGAGIDRLAAGGSGVHGGGHRPQRGQGRHGARYRVAGAQAPEGPLAGGAREDRSQARGLPGFAPGALRGSGRVGHHPRRPLRGAGAAGGEGGGGRHRARGVADGCHPLRRAPRGDRADERPEGPGRRGSQGDSTHPARADGRARTAQGRDAGRARRRGGLRRPERSREGRAGVARFGAADRRRGRRRARHQTGAPSPVAGG